MAGPLTTDHPQTLSAADEVNNLQPIALGKVGGSPLFTRHDVSIQFHGHATRFHAQRVYECRK